MGDDDLRLVAPSNLLGLVQALRWQSESLRLERRRRAKVALKWTSALTLFSLPSIVFVILGPGMG
jgi:hypothetical protein